MAQMAGFTTKSSATSYATMKCRKGYNAKVVVAEYKVIYSKR